MTQTMSPDRTKTSSSIKRAVQTCFVSKRIF